MCAYTFSYHAYVCYLIVMYTARPAVADKYMKKLYQKYWRMIVHFNFFSNSKHNLDICSARLIHNQFQITLHENHFENHQVFHFETY